MRFSWVKIVVATLVIGLSFQAARNARATSYTPGVDFTTSGGANSAANWTLGYSFLANQNAQVVALGVWNSWASEGSEMVGLWTLTGTLLASVSVSNTSPTTGTANWSYEAITQVDLTAGDSYVVGALSSNTNWTAGANISTSPEITYISARYDQGGSFAFPGSAFGNNGDFGANVFFAGAGSSAVPEPATIALLATGLAPVAFRRRRR